MKNTGLRRGFAVSAIAVATFGLGFALLGSNSVSAKTLSVDAIRDSIIPPIADGSNVVIMPGPRQGSIVIIDGALRAKAASFSNSAKASFDK